MSEDQARYLTGRDPGDERTVRLRHVGPATPQTYPADDLAAALARAEALRERAIRAEVARAEAEARVRELLDEDVIAVVVAATKSEEGQKA